MAPPPGHGSERDDADPRVLWAAERTLLAWIRTGVAVMGFGFIVARFGVFLRELAIARNAAPGEEVKATLVGIAMVVLGIILNILVTLRYRKIATALTEGRHLDLSLRLPTAVAIGSAVVGGVLVGLLVATSLR